MTEEALFAWKKLLGQYQPYSILRRGLLGDGNGTVAVAGKTGWSWIRYADDQHKLSMVRNIAVGDMPEDTPVLVGKRHPDDGYEQILQVDWALYSLSPSETDIDQFTTPPHGGNHAGKAADPVPVDMNNLEPGKVVPTSPASLEVTVQPFIFTVGTDVWEWEEDEIDLTGDVPGVAGHCYVLVYIDVTAQELGSVASDVVGLVDDPQIPSCESDWLPLAVVDLENGQTQILAADIWQYKVMYGATGGSSLFDLILTDGLGEIMVDGDGNVMTE